jgi:hypothetical protein
MDMQRRTLLIGCLGTIGLPGLIKGSQNESSERTIRLRFPEQVDLTDLSIRYFLTGPFGGFGGFVRTDPNVREYAIPTWLNGEQGTTLRAIVYCPGYRIVLLTEPSLAERSTEDVSIQLEPLPTVPLSGHIVSVAGLPDLRIEAMYDAFWSHSFFGMADGAVVSFAVATSDVAADGRFLLNLPDLASDPVVEAFGQGRFRLIGRDGRTGNIVYRIRDSRISDGFSFPIAKDYPDEWLFTGVPF